MVSFHKEEDMKWVEFIEEIKKINTKNERQEERLIGQGERLVEIGKRLRNLIGTMRKK